MRSEPVRQNAIIEYMVAHGKGAPYTTRQIASALGITTSAVLAAFKRLRTKGKVFRLSDRWYMTSAEQLRQSELNHPSNIEEVSI